MKSPRLLRPLFILGVLVIVLAFVSWLTIPGWQTSILGTAALLVAIVIGLYAMIRDMLVFIKELKDMEQKGKDE